MPLKQKWMLLRIKEKPSKDNDANGHR